MVRAGEQNRYELTYAPWTAGGRRLADLLAKDGYLYTGLGLPVWFIRCGLWDREDLRHDFFLHICSKADQFSDGWEEIEDLGGNQKARTWLNVALARFASRYRRSLSTKVRKQYKRQRPESWSLSAEKVSEGFADLAYTQWARDKGYSFPGRLLVEAEEAAEISWAARKIREAIEGVLPALHKTEREACRLHFLMGLTGLQTARVMGVSAGTVWSSLWWGRQKLRKLLPPEMADSLK